jgi:hypothetical protein
MSLRLLGCILALVIPVVAQNSPNKKSDGIEVRLLAEFVPPNLGKVFLQLGEEARSEAIDLPTNQLSQPISCPSRTLVLKTEEKEISLCTINLPEPGKSFAIILVTAKPSGYAPIIVRTDDPAFKAGDVMFINRSEKTILGKLGDTPLILKPGGSAKNRPSGAIENTYYNIAFATRDESGDKLISSSRWPIDENLRSYLFFFTTAAGKTTFRAVDEYLVP